MKLAAFLSYAFIHRNMNEFTEKIESGFYNKHETWSDHEVWIQEKEDQVQLLLKRAEGLSVEKSDPNESIVYDAMAKDLTEVRMQSSSD